MSYTFTSKPLQPLLQMRFIGKMHKLTAVCNKQINEEQFKQLKTITNITSRFLYIQHKRHI